MGPAQTHILNFHTEYYVSNAAGGRASGGYLYVWVVGTEHAFPSGMQDKMIL